MSVRVRLVDVAEEAGVSRVAVGKVLLNSGGDHIKVSDGTAKRIRRAAQKLGYQPNRSAQRLRGKTGNLIGAVINMNAPAIERDRLVALERLAWARGFQLLISALPVPENIEDVGSCASVLTGQGAAGVIFLTGGVVVAGNEDDPRLPSKAVYCGIKSVIGEAPGVILDLADGFHQMIAHFAKDGRKRVGLLTEEGTMEPNLYSDFRVRVVSESVQQFEGLELTHYSMPVCPEVRKPSIEEAGIAVETLLAAGVDAILANDDHSAARVIQVLNRRGVRVPEDVAVCGLGNVDIADLTSPAMTTVDERPADVSEAMLDLMIAQLAGAKPVGAQRVIKPKLIIRESA